MCFLVKRTNVWIWILDFLIIPIDFLNQSYVTIQKFTMSYTVYQKMTIIPPDLQKRFPALLQTANPIFVKPQRKY